MKIKAITFLFLVTVLNNAYSMSVEDKNNRILSLGDSFIQGNNNQGSIQQNGFSGGGNINTGQKKKKRIEESNSGNKFYFEDKGPAESFSDFLIEHNYIKDAPLGYVCLICERNLRNIQQAHMHFKSCHCKVKYDGTNYSFEGEMDRHYRIVHSSAIVGFEQSNYQQNNTQNNFKKTLPGFKGVFGEQNGVCRAIIGFEQNNDQQNNMQNNSKKSLPSFKDVFGKGALILPSFKQAFGEGVLILPSFKSLFGKQNGSNDSGNINIGQGPEDKRRKLN